MELHEALAIGVCSKLKNQIPGNLASFFSPCNTNSLLVNHYFVDTCPVETCLYKTTS